VLRDEIIRENTNKKKAKKNYYSRNEQNGIETFWLEFSWEIWNGPDLEQDKIYSGLFYFSK